MVLYSVSVRGVPVSNHNPGAMGVVLQVGSKVVHSTGEADAGSGGCGCG